MLHIIPIEWAPGTGQVHQTQTGRIFSPLTSLDKRLLSFCEPTGLERGRRGGASLREKFWVKKSVLVRSSQ